jgi:hypothetical protein
MRLTGTIFAFLQCLKLVYFMVHQAVVAAALIMLISDQALLLLLLLLQGPRQGMLEIRTANRYAALPRRSLCGR